MTTSSKTRPQGLYGKILAAQKAIDAVPKRGFNAYHKYHYATEADILTVKETLNANGLIVLPTVQDQQTGFKPDGKSWASVTLLFRVVDAESGEAIESQFTGYAEDNFDKAIYKATTGANKYFYLKFFGIATEDDPEREDTAPQATGRGNTPPVRAVVNNRGVNGAITNGSGNKPANATGDKDAGAATTVVDPGKRNQALTNANKILALQKQYGLSNDEVLRFGEIASIKELAEEGQADTLASAYQKLSRHVQLQAAQ